jgi:hypothetical protein
MWTRRVSQAVEVLTVIGVIKGWREVAHLDIIHYNVEEM